MFAKNNHTTHAMDDEYWKNSEKVMVGEHTQTNKQIYYTSNKKGRIY